VQLQCSKIDWISTLISTVADCLSRAYKQSLLSLHSYLQTSEVILLYTLQHHSISFELCLPWHSVHHPLPPVQKCSNVRDSYKLRDFWPLNSPDLNTVDYKIWGNDSTSVWLIWGGVLLMCKLVWNRALLHWTVVQTFSRLHSSHKRTFWIFTVK